MTQLYRLRVAFAVMALGSLALPGPAQADPTRFAGCTPVGRVAAMTGEVLARRSPQRVLACGDELCVGDLVSTGPGASLGILNGGFLTQVGENSRVKLALTPDGVPDVVVQAGTVRMIDARAEGAPGNLAALGTAAELRRSDAEARVSGETGRICSHGGGVAVNGTAVDAGSCAVAGTTPLRVAANEADSPELSVLAGACDPGPVIAPIAHIGPTPPVASPPLLGPAPLPNPPGGPLRTCELTGCGNISVQGQPPVSPSFP